MLLVIARAPSDPEAQLRAAVATGLAPSDITLRLAGMLPRVLLSDSDGERLRSLASELDAAGFTTICCDPAEAPTDRDRVVAREIAFGAEEVEVVDRAQRRHSCPRAAVGLLQRGCRFVVESEKVTTFERRFAPMRAVLTGGLLATRNVARTEARQQETREPFLVIQRLDHQPEIVLYERRLNYRFLGAALQPATRTNFALVVQRLRVFLPRAAFDERVAQEGYVKAMPTTVVDAVDLALHLVKLVQLRPSSPYRS
jgi:hypothetical protein